MVQEGGYFGLPLLVLGLLGVFWRGWGLFGPIAGAILVFLAAFTFYFFRNPERIVPQQPGLVVSPADGRIVVVKGEENAGRPGTRISIFLAVWNVHVNRSPAEGRIIRLEYRPGQFLEALRDRASVDNEANIFWLETPGGQIVFKQIAGLIARRVVSWKKPGDIVERGERIGLVRFGSRMDLWLPSGAQILVAVGDHVKGGSSVVARWVGKQKITHAAEEELVTAEMAAHEV